MHPHLRKSIFTKGAALGFCSNLLLGNFWLAFNFAGGESPAWLSKAMFYSTAVVVVSGLGMAYVYSQILMGRVPLEDEEDEDQLADAQTAVEPEGDRPGEGASRHDTH